MNLSSWLASFNRNEAFNPGGRVKLFIDTRNLYMASPYWPSLTNRIRQYGIWMPENKLWTFMRAQTRTLLVALAPMVGRTEFNMRVSGRLNGTIDGVGITALRHPEHFNWALGQLFGFPRRAYRGREFVAVLRPDIDMGETVGLEAIEMNELGDGVVSVDLATEESNNPGLQNVLGDYSFLRVIHHHPATETSRHGEGRPTRRVIQAEIIEEEPPEEHKPHVRRIRG